MTRGRAIWARCKECAGNAAEVRRCKFPDCSLFRFRTGDDDKTVLGVRVPRQKAIRAHCLWCCNGQAPEVRLCLATSCALYPFRGSAPIVN